MQTVNLSEKPLGKIELIAIALGGMIGGGIFSVLGVSTDIVGDGTPVAIFLGGVLAYFAAYSYAKLARYYKDEGATYSFFKKTFPAQKFAITLIGWLIVFGYISTLALYAFTFASYFSSFLPGEGVWQIRIIALSVIILFALINLLSVKGMGRIEDLMVYTKVALLLIISGLFLRSGNHSLDIFGGDRDFSISNIFIVAAITFVAYEGFQLVIHAYDEAENPGENVPSAIYWSIGAATIVYVVLAVGALSTIPHEILIRDKEYALAGGASDILGPAGYGVVVAGALLATSSAINGTIFGASRLMAVIAKDGVFPEFFAKRSKGHIPHYAIIAMSVLSYIFILSGGLQAILEFGSITFIVVSFLMAYSNYKIRDKTGSNMLMALLAMVFLGIAGVLILYYEARTDYRQVLSIFCVYALLAVLAKVFSLKFSHSVKLS